MTNSADPDQLASSEANWSGSTLFAKTGYVLFSKRRVKILFLQKFEVFFSCLFIRYFFALECIRQSWVNMTVIVLIGLYNSDNSEKKSDETQTKLYTGAKSLSETAWCLFFFGCKLLWLSWYLVFSCLCNCLNYFTLACQSAVVWK